MVLTIYEFQKLTKSLNDYALKSVLDRARVVVTSEPVEACQHCKQIPLVAWRGDRRYCSRACKQKAYRQRKDKTK